MPKAILDVLDFFREFGNLLNTTLITTLGALLLKILHATISQKDAQIAVLDEQLQLAEMFSAKNVKEKFDALQEWYDCSIKNLEEEKRKAVKLNETEFMKKIDEEIWKRNEIVDSYTKKNRSSSELLRGLSRHEVLGSYLVVGHNPYGHELSYFGELKIREKGEVLEGNWSIGPKNQKHVGVGVVLGNTIAFTFLYVDPMHNTRTGVVLYQFVGPDIMRGFWTGFGSKSLGFEECRKVGAEF